MARPRVPTHLKPVPTTISMLRSHREWMDEGSISPSALVNRLISEHRADNESTREARRGLDRVERTLATLAERDEEALDVAKSIVADQLPSNNLAAMLLARLQATISNDINPVTAEALIDHLKDFVVNETPDSVPVARLVPAPVLRPKQCEWLVQNGRRQCRKQAHATLGRFCAQHHRMNEHVDMSEGF